MAMRRVLIISYYWPPSGGSGVQRWVKFAKYLPEMGWEPVVYTPSNPEVPALDESLAAEVDGVEIIRTRIFEPYGLYAKLFRREKAAAPEVNTVDAGKRSLAGRIALWLRGNLFIPDPKCLWVRPSVRYLEKYLREHPVDAIVSTGPPHTMHLIARALARKTGLPWVADFRDPWTKVFYFKHLSLTACARRRHEKLEKQVLDDASLVVAVSPMVQDEFRAMTSTPVALVTNGYDEADYVRQEGACRAETSMEGAPASHEAVAFCGEERAFTLVHTGLFARDGIPTVLWEVLAEKCAVVADFHQKLRIVLVGKTDREVLESLSAAGLQDQVTDWGYQPHPTAVARQLEASVLLLPLRKEPEYKAVLPGKLFEYLGSGRPILGIGAPDGAMARILQDLTDSVSDGASGAIDVGYTVCDWEDKAAMAAYIDKAWGAFCGRTGSDEPSDAPGRRSPHPDVSRYSRRSTAAAMARLLTEVCSRNDSSDASGDDGMKNDEYEK